MENHVAGSIPAKMQGSPSKCLSTDVARTLCLWPCPCPWLRKGMISFLKNIFYWLCYYSCPIFPPSLPSTLHTPSCPHSPTFSSCPWVIHISSFASTFPTLFLPSPCLFSTYQLCYLFSVPFLPPPLTPLLITLHVISISVVLFLF